MATLLESGSLVQRLPLASYRILIEIPNSVVQEASGDAPRPHRAHVSVPMEFYGAVARAAARP
jgi:hypothetical protein